MRSRRPNPQSEVILPPQAIGRPDRTLFRLLSSFLTIGTGAGWRPNRGRPTPAAIALLSDFGTRDPYVGIMKGAIAQIAPDIRTIDLTHQIPPQDIAAGRFALAAAAAYFPVGTVFLAVVDPGVGSSRRAIAVECGCGWLVGPDNGLFGGILALFPATAAVCLENSRYWLQSPPSATFHGRDIFAPVAAHLAMGVPLEKLGPAIDPNSPIDLALPNWQQTPAGATGAIQAIDGFGNLVTNIPGTQATGRDYMAHLGPRTIRCGRTYSDVSVGEAIVLVGSHGWLEIALAGGSAAGTFAAAIGMPVEIEFLLRD